MNLEATYAARAVPAGSDRYWSWHFASAQSRDALLAALALMAEWDGPASPQREPALTLAKLAWWREEIDRYAAGAPLHPITRFIAAWPSHDPELSALLASAIHRAWAEDEERDAPLLLLVARSALPQDSRDAPAVRTFCERLAAPLWRSRRPETQTAERESAGSQLRETARTLAQPLRAPLRGLIVLAELRAQRLADARGDRTVSVWRAWRAARSALKPSS